MMLAASGSVAASGNAALVSFCIYTAVVFALAWLAGP